MPRVLELYEMQSVSSRIWTRVAVSISYDDNHYTTDTIYIYIYIYIYTLVQKDKATTKKCRNLVWSKIHIFINVFSNKNIY